MSRITELQEEYKAKYGYTLLETDYIGYYTPMLYTCSCGNQHKMSLQHVRRGKKCPACQPRRRFSIAEVRQVFLDGGCELLDFTYSNALTPLNYRCSCGNESFITLAKFKAGQRCKECGKEKYQEGLHSVSTETMRQILSAQGHTLIKWNGTNNQSVYQCRCGEIETVQINTYCYKNKRHCSKCQEKLMQESISSARGCTSYSTWKKECQKLDDYACIICGSTTKLVAHHLESFKHKPEWRYSTVYGRTLCQICHTSYHSAFGTIPTIEDWEELMDVMYES